MIADVKEKLPEERLNSMIIPMNTSQERFLAESGFKSLRSYFYSGESKFMYVDYTKDIENPEMKYIDTWDDVIAYVRGIK